MFSKGLLRGRWALNEFWVFWAFCLLGGVGVLGQVGCSDDSSSPGPCKGITCSGHGECVVVDGKAACECQEGYEAQGLMCVDDGEEVGTTDQIVQHGVVWTFGEAVPFGRYANGDYWVVGPVTVVGVSPAFDGGHHGWEVNPSDPVSQGFDERVADFDPSRVPELPYTAGPGESLVKGVSLTPLGEDCRPCLETAVVLTVVADVPEGQGERLFRPPYFGGEKPVYAVDDLRTELLPSLAAVGEPPPLEEIAGWFRRVQLDHKTNWVGRALHPEANMPDYGSSIASRNAVGALRLMLEDPLVDKEPALVVYVQMGIDLYHMLLNGGSWPPNGGHSEGRKLPVAFAALLLDDATIQDAVRDSTSEDFGENGGMYLSSESDTVLYGQQDNTEENYWTNLVFDTGSRTIKDPYGWIDGGHRPGGSYQFCCTAQPWKGSETALRLLSELQALWDHGEFSIYVERWVTFGAWTQPDPCAPPNGVCAGGDNAGAECTSANEPEVCTGEDGHCDLTVSWDAGYGVDYGPDGQGGCILDDDDSDGTGRFPLLHGVNDDGGHYGSGFVDALWEEYVAPSL